MVTWCSHQVLDVALRFSELHNVHAFAGVPTSLAMVEYIQGIRGTSDQLTNVKRHDAYTWLRTGSPHTLCFVSKCHTEIKKMVAYADKCPMEHLLNGR
jgi:hypothetical protein